MSRMLTGFGTVSACLIGAGDAVTAVTGREFVLGSWCLRTRPENAIFFVDKLRASGFGRAQSERGHRRNVAVGSGRSGTIHPGDRDSRGILHSATPMYHWGSASRELSRVFRPCTAPQQPALAHESGGNL